MGERSLYASQLPTRPDSPARRLELSFPLLSTLSVKEAMEPAGLIASPTESLSSIEARLRAAGTKRAAVVDGLRLVGVVSMTDIGRVALDKRSETEVRTGMTADPATVVQSETLDVALGHLSDRRVSWLPVIDSDDNRHLVGQLQTQAIVRIYRNRVNQGVRELHGLTDATSRGSADGAMLSVRP